MSLREAEGALARAREARVRNDWVAAEAARLEADRHISAYHRTRLRIQTIGVLLHAAFIIFLLWALFGGGG